MVKRKIWRIVRFWLYKIKIFDSLIYKIAEKHSNKLCWHYIDDYVWYKYKQDNYETLDA